MEKKLRAIVLLILHSGIRISDVVLLQRDRIKDGKMLIYTQKTGTPVWCPSLAVCDEGDPYYL
jgi:hypothetical protein